MGRRYQRHEVIARLDAQRRKGIPILAATAGNGLMAKLIEMGGADLILVYGTAYTRMQGLPSIARQPRPDRELVTEMIKDQFMVTRDIPLICGISVCEYSADDDLGAVADEYISLGFSGVTNFKTSGSIENSDFVELARKSPHETADQKTQYEGEMEAFSDAAKYTEMGLGTSREEELIKVCRRNDIFTVAYTFTADQAVRYTHAGADMIVGHCGGTAGGLVGHETVLDYSNAARRLNEIFDAARSVDPSVFTMGHGGPFWNPESTRQMYALTGCDGYVAGSAVERIPVEKAVIGAVKEFKSVARA